MEASNEPVFAAEAGIGRGSGLRARWVDRRGAVRVEQERLVLSKRDGEIIIEAPMSEVWADRPRIGGGAVLKLTISGQTYTVEPARVHHSPVHAIAESAGNVGRDIGRLKKGREMTEHFLAVLEAGGGHRGSPES